MRDASIPARTPSRVLSTDVLIARTPLVGAYTIFTPRLQRDGSLALPLPGDGLGPDLRGAGIGNTTSHSQWKREAYSTGAA